MLGVNGSVSSLPRRIGTLLVPGRRDWRAAVGDTDLVESVRHLTDRAERVTSVCAGAFVLAATGVLDGRRAATHWELAPDLAAAFPGIRVESDPLFVRDGHVVTSAGCHGGIDLALSLVEEDWGPRWRAAWPGNWSSSWPGPADRPSSAPDCSHVSLGTRR